MRDAVGGVGRARLGKAVNQQVDGGAGVQVDKVLRAHQARGGLGDDALLGHVLGGALGHGHVVLDVLGVKRHGAAVHLVELAGVGELGQVPTDGRLGDADALGEVPDGGRALVVDDAQDL